MIMAVLMLMLVSMIVIMILKGSSVGFPGAGTPISDDQVTQQALTLQVFPKRDLNLKFGLSFLGKLICRQILVQASIFVCFGLRTISSLLYLSSVKIPPLKTFLVYTPART